MLDLDLPFPQAISAFADGCEAAAAGTFPYVFYFGQHCHDCHAIAIFFGRRDSLECCATSLILAGAIPQMLQIFQEASAIADCHTTNFQ
jgi:hypothetical protein